MINKWSAKIRVSAATPAKNCPPVRLEPRFVTHLVGARVHRMSRSFSKYGHAQQRLVTAGTRCAIQSRREDL
jgi:hypothetical protein